MFKFILTLLVCIGAKMAVAQDYCQISIPRTTEIIKKTPATERNGNDKTYWICGNARITFRTGGATLFVEAGCNVSLNDGSYTVYAKNGASVYVGNRCQVTLIREPQARINGATTVLNERQCPVLNYDYSEAPDNLCPKTPLREMPAQVMPLPTDTAVFVPHTLVEIPQNPDLPTEPNANETRYILPAYTKVISQQTNLYQSNGAFWICNQATLWINGDNNKIYIEGGANLTIIGNKNIILMKAGGKLNLGKGGANELMYQIDADMKSNASKSTKFTKMQEILFQTGAVVGGCK